MAYMVDRPDPSGQFLEDRFNALKYIDNFRQKFTDGNFGWIKTELSYPGFDDFTFSYMCSIYSVMVLRATDTGRLLNVPPRIDALREEASRNNLVPCVFPINDRTGRPFFKNSWNLVNPFTGKRVTPDTDSSNELTELSQCELLNWAVNIVMDYIDKQGLKLDSFCDAPGIEPQIWFQDKNNSHCWVKVFPCVYPDDGKGLSFDLTNYNHPELLNHDGYTAKVSFMPMNAPKLYRTHPADVNFRGLELIHTHS